MRLIGESTDKCIWAIIIIGIVTHLIFHLIMPTVLSPDAVLYDTTAKNLIEGNGFVLEDEIPIIKFGPGYPLILAGLFLLFEYNYFAAYFLNMIFLILTSYLIYKYGKKVFSSTIALIAALFLLFNIRILTCEHTVLTEIPYLFGLTALCIMAESAEGKKYLYFILMGILTGLLLLIRPTIMFWPLIFGVFWVLKHKAEKRRIVEVLLYCFITFLTILPWTIRNYSLYNEIIPVSAGFGFVLWPGNDPSRYGQQWGIQENLEYDIELKGTNVVEQDHELTVGALHWMTKRPLVTAKIWLIKLWEFWGEDFWNPLHKLRTEGQYGNYAIIGYIWKFIESIILLLFLVGLVKSYKKIPFITLLFVYFTLVHVVTLVESRYRVPLIPLQLLIAVYGASLVLSYLKSMFRNKKVSTSI
ncbi:MAG: glycosyltransferase family 39 protein [candidate division Zixibacteria bacterium]|nr:glycosyltransferase family 39 protein [candidate division Zixibacteria bacterium]